MKTKTRTNNKNNCFKVSTICLSVVSVVLLASTIFFGLQRPTRIESKEIEAFQTLAARYVEQGFRVDGEIASAYDGLGISKDDDLYISFTLTKMDGHVGTARRNYRLYFQCKEEKKYHDAEPYCAIAGGADDWEDIPEEEQAEMRRLIEEMEEKARENSSD